MDIREKFEEYSSEVNHRLYKELNGNIDELNQNEREVVRIWRLEADMCNGGFLQFFCNWGYPNFVETQKVLKKIGTNETLAIITECEKIISKAQDDKRIKKLWDVAEILGEYLTEEEDKRLDELDEKYWADPDDIQRIGYEHYIKK